MKKITKKDIYPLLFILIVLIILFFLSYPICILRNITGLPCLLCGMTRAYYYLFTLNIAKAFTYHPLWWAIPIIILINLYYSNPKYHKLVVKLNIVFLLLFIVVYLIRMITLFPHIEPMDYKKDNIINKVLQNKAK